MRLIGQNAKRYDHICHSCQGKAAKRLFRLDTKRQKRAEERQWRKEAGL